MSIFTRGERRNCVENERDVGIFRERAANFRQRIHYAGRCFVVNQCDSVEFSGRERAIEILRVNVFPPIDLKRLGGFAAASRDIEPFVRERAAHAAEHAAIDQIPD